MGIFPTDDDVVALSKYERAHLPRAWAVVRAYGGYAALRKYYGRWWVVDLADYAEHLGHYTGPETFEEATGLSREFAVALAPEELVRAVSDSNSLHALLDNLCISTSLDTERHRRMRDAFGRTSDWYLDEAQYENSHYLRYFDPRSR